MSIRVVCPNGHVLNVKDSMAGTKGLCPTCRAVVEVTPPAATLEDEILGLLGTMEPHSNGSASTKPKAERTRVDGAELRATTPKKACSRCHREIDLAAHICPHCHTYIACLADFNGK
jgi:hypothetical protein